MNFLSIIVQQFSPCLETSQSSKYPNILEGRALPSNFIGFSDELWKHPSSLLKFSPLKADHSSVWVNFQAALSKAFGPGLVENSSLRGPESEKTKLVTCLIPFVVIIKICCNSHSYKNVFINVSYGIKFTFYFTTVGSCQGWSIPPQPPPPPIIYISSYS